MSIVDWFNPNNPVHVKAYKTLLETGAWPEGFKPADMEMPPGWNGIIAAKMADCWINHVMSIEETKNRHQRIKNEYEASKKASIASKPKEGKVLAMMADGWKLRRDYGVRSLTPKYHIARGSEWLSVHANTVRSLLESNKISKLPNGYPLTNPTFYELVKS